MTKRVALFAGTFDPYTNGHHAIVRKAAALFDEVVVMVAVNIHKKRAFDAGAMAGAIRETLAADGLFNATVVMHGGLVADYCAEHGVGWFVRGLRGETDYSYEEANARVNKLLNPALETVYLRGDDDAISSTMVRELLAFGRDVDAFLPAPVAELIHEINKTPEEKQ